MNAKKPAALPERPYQLWALIPDVHLGHEDQRALAVVEKYLADERWDGWASLGDLLDCDAISEFNREFPRQRVSVPTVKEEFDYANRFLDRHIAAVRHHNPGARCVYLEGNHEFRTERYVDRLPELEGFVNVENGLRLKERRIEYVRFWSKGEMVKLGKLYLAHGYLTGPNHARRHATEYGVCIAYGHLHDLQVSVIKRRGKDKPISATSLGCLCTMQPGYMRGRPVNWTTAFGVAFIHPDGYFQLMPVPIINNRFIGPSNGKLYQ